jgi:hypothetical protein
MEGHRSELCARLELRLTDGRAADALHKLWSPFGSRRPRRCHSTYLILNINTDYVLTSEPKFVPVDTHAHKLWLTKPHRLCGSEHDWQEMRRRLFPLRDFHSVVRIGSYAK